MEDFNQPADRLNLWAVATILGVVLGFVLGGFAIAHWLGGIEWARIYGIAIGVLIILGALFGGVYGTMRLLVGHALGLQRSNADLLHAHSMSGAQQARAVTEVIRGANAINRADAETQQAILQNFGKIGAEYEKQLARMAGRLAMAEGRAALPDNHQSAGEMEIVEYDVPADAMPYKMPRIS